MSSIHDSRHPKRAASGITVIVPDLSEPVSQGLEKFNKHVLSEGGVPASHMDAETVGFVLTKKGMYALSTEGIGPAKPITSKNKLEVELRGNWRNAEGKSEKFSVFPDGVLELTDDELMMLPVLREVPLEDFIRVFGSRPEANYQLWLDTLQKAGKMPLDGVPVES